VSNDNNDREAPRALGVVVGIDLARTEPRETVLGPRTPLQRRVNGTWTSFEAQLFNLVTKNADRPIGGFFSARLRVAQAMLDAFDAAVEKERT
jgi:hypothetical protein